MLKIKEKKNQLTPQDKDTLLKLGYTTLTSNILLDRFPDKSLEEIKTILRGNIDLDSIEIKEVSLASEYFLNIIENTDKKILVITDYDCDGISSAVVAYRLLSKVINNDRFKVITNKRKFGNGISKELIETIPNFDTYDLIITADHGSSNNEVFKELKEKNKKLEIIITDHHTFTRDNYPSEAIYFINNQRSLEEKEWEPLKDLSGCFMLFFFLYKTLKHKLTKETILIEAFPFLAITAISDVMSMNNSINRALIRIGLRIMNDDRHTLFKTIKWYCVPEKHYSVETIKFFLSPLINTGNRQHCEDDAFCLLSSDDKKEIIEKLEILLFKNNERKKFTNELTTAIISSPKLHGEYGKTITIKTSMGINGIIASKVGEIKQKPMICFVHENGYYHGSCRSILPNINILSILERLNIDGLIEKFGGHREAAGCTVLEKNIEQFRKKFDEYTKEELLKNSVDDSIDVFCRINPELLKANNFINLKHLEPLGKDFETPIFHTELIIKNAFSSNSMTFMSFENISPMIKGVAFHNGKYDPLSTFQKGNLVSLIFTMNLSYFKGLYQTSVNILNAKLVGDDHD